MDNPLEWCPSTQTRAIIKNMPTAATVKIMVTQKSQMARSIVWDMLVVIACWDIWSVRNNRILRNKKHIVYQLLSYLCWCYALCRYLGDRPEIKSFCALCYERSYTRHSNTPSGPKCHDLRRWGHTRRAGVINDALAGCTCFFAMGIFPFVPWEFSGSSAQTEYVNFDS